MIHLSGVYGIFNSRSHRAYIGSSRNVVMRWRQHHRSLCQGIHDNPHLQNAWRHYGLVSFVFILLERVKPDELAIREQHWMGKFSLYNVCPAAESRAGAKWTEDSRRKMQGNKNGFGARHIHTPEIRLRMSLAQRGKRSTVEANRKRSEALKGHAVSAETREKIGLKHRGKIVSQATRDKQSAAALARRARERSAS